MRVNYFSDDQNCYIYEEEDCERQFRTGDCVELFKQLLTVGLVVYIPQDKVLIVWVSKT